MKKQDLFWGEVSQGTWREHSVRACVNCREDDLGEIGRYKQCKGLKAVPGIWLLSREYWRAAKRSWLGEWHAVERREAGVRATNQEACAIYRTEVRQIYFQTPPN